MYILIRCNPHSSTQLTCKKYLCNTAYRKLSNYVMSPQISSQTYFKFTAIICYVHTINIATLRKICQILQLHEAQTLHIFAGQICKMFIKFIIYKHFVFSVWQLLWSLIKLQNLFLFYSWQLLHNHIIHGSCTLLAEVRYVCITDYLQDPRQTIILLVIKLPNLQEQNIRWET